MGRIVLAEPRYLDLTWHQDEERFVLRLLEGNRYVTPKLRLSPLNVLQLMRHERVTLGEWLSLGRPSGGALAIGLTKTRALWPEAQWTAFYALATQVRGERPESGWHKQVESELEAERDRWEPA